VIYYHPAENPNITYGILQSRKIFEDLGTFTLARGLREVRRVQLAKEDREKKLNNPKANAMADEGEHRDAGAEKARLLESEGVNRRDSSQEPDLEAGVSPRTSAEEPVTRSLMSPNPMSDNPYGSADSPVSEKARGKMRERRSASVDTINSLDRVPTAIGRNGFVPTQEWVSLF